jgi:hypothetical protein
MNGTVEALPKSIRRIPVRLEAEFVEELAILNTPELRDCLGLGLPELLQGIGTQTSNIDLSLDKVRKYVSW